MLLREERLEGVHPDLKNVVLEAASQAPFDITVVEGVRTLEREKELLKEGKTTTLNSRHLVQTCGYACAVDIAPTLNGAVIWTMDDYVLLAPFVKQAAKDLGVEVEWGGDWHSFKDGPHWQLPARAYH